MSLDGTPDDMPETQQQGQTPASFREQREAMVKTQLEDRGITDQRVLAAFRVIPRHEFFPPGTRAYAYADGAYPIGLDQTISQPFIVAYMTQCLELDGQENVLEIGTGSGYQTALLCMLARSVISVERHTALAQRAAEMLARLNLRNASLFVGDGSQGFAEHGPYNAILCAATAPQIPIPLAAQLADGGRLVMPAVETGARPRKTDRGEQEAQALYRVRRQGNTWHTEKLIPVAFVPLVGRYGYDTVPGDPPHGQN